MAILKVKKIREMSEKDMDEKLRELKLELSKDLATSEIGTVKNPGRIKEIRRTIAKLETVKKQGHAKKETRRGD